MALYGDGSNVNKTTSVSAGNYGGSSAVPVITVDSNQRISAINTASITLTAAINANASHGDIGTYAFMQQASGNTTYDPGDTLAGSSLRYSDATGRTHTETPLGNWRCMGYDSGAALVNSGSGTGSGSGSGNISGNIQGNLSGNLQGGNVQGNTSIQGGNVQGNTSIQGGNVQGNTNVQGGKGGSVSTDHLGVSANVSTDNLGVSANVSTDHLGVGGSVDVGGDNTNVGGNASVNVTVNSVSVNTTVAYSATLWLRYS